MTKEPIRKTKIRLEIDKTIQPKQFEPIKIIVDIEESFYWESEDERNDKIRKCRDMILEDFVTSYDEAVTVIGEKERCIGKIITKGDVPVQGKQEVKADNKNSEDEEWSF